MLMYVHVNVYMYVYVYLVAEKGYPEILYMYVYVHVGHLPSIRIRPGVATINPDVRIHVYYCLVQCHTDTCACA